MCYLSTRSLGLTTVTDQSTALNQWTNRNRGILSGKNAPKCKVSSLLAVGVCLGLKRPNFSCIMLANTPYHTQPKCNQWPLRYLPGPERWERTRWLRFFCFTSHHPVSTTLTLCTVTSFLFLVLRSQCMLPCLKEAAEMTRAPFVVGLKLS